MYGSSERAFDEVIELIETGTKVLLNLTLKSTLEVKFIAMLMRWSKRSHRNNQIQIKKSFSNENQKAINTCKKLLLTILLIKISELPFVNFLG